MASRQDMAKAILDAGYGMAMTAKDIQRCFGWGHTKTYEFIADLPKMKAGKYYFYLDVVDKLLGRRITDPSKDRNRGAYV